jgi:hypothetical protein
MIKIKCPKCNWEFGVDEDRVLGSSNKIAVEFRCPYCGNVYKVGDTANIVGMSGGVNINGSVRVNGDIVGRDKVKRDKVK